MTCEKDDVGYFIVVALDAHEAEVEGSAHLTPHTCEVLAEIP